MPRITIVQRDGSSLTVEGKTGHSVMEVIRESGVDELLALSGGCCSCATCHVFVDPEFAEALPDITEDENDLLDSSSFRDDRSRLSCQLVCREELDGLTVTVAPED